MRKLLILPLLLATMELCAQEDPEYNTFLLKSYNRPEFMVEPVKISVDEFSKVFDK
jgi:hypothetical protein